MPDDDTPKLTRGLNQSHGSFELVLSPVILGLIGLWFDHRLGTGPWIAVAAAIAGLVGATTKLVVDYKARMSVLSATRWTPSFVSERSDRSAP